MTDPCPWSGKWPAHRARSGEVQEFSAVHLGVAPKYKSFLSRVGFCWRGIEQQGKELTTHFAAARNDGNAREQWFIRVRHDAVPKNVYDRGAPRRRRIVCI